MCHRSLQPLGLKYHQYLYNMSKERNRIDGIYVPLKVGDIIYTGRFKNKKTTVKTIGVDEHGMPTVNGKRVITFRLNPPEKK